MITIIDAVTTARVVDCPTPTVPPSVLRPCRQAIAPIIIEKTSGLTIPPIKSSVVIASRTAEINTLDDTEYNATAVTQPPTMPMQSANTVNNGKLINKANIRGATSLRTGSVPRARIASICCETTIEPSSAEIAEPTRPVTISAQSTGPSSLTSETATR